ncbi:hypothetical protein [Methanobrevibacter millerae]|uniref:Uncharacterized protein n=1 Tax=Methanobrevibacter millerae TaxID=230361 RepID=A0A1G5WHG3_9EURY|nr:hypothetical protein [Methanobrevibacter millerae]SDA57334.1 hypothetical protein SAMN02910315_01404 [Methanobrevibacter millerae]
MTSSLTDSLTSSAELNDKNMDLIYEEIKEFLHLYFFKGYISNNLNKSIEDLFDLSHDDLNTLKAIHFLLSDEVKNLVEIIPMLIRNLSHSTRKETEEFHGQVKGRIDWNQTIKARFSQGYDDKSLFVCQPPSKYYDLEENQLLKFILNKIIFLKRNFVDFIFLNELNLEKIDSKDWQESISNIYQMTKKTLKKVYFDDISSIKEVKSKHLRKTYKNRNQLYHLVAKAYILYEDLFINDDIEILRNLVENRIIKAANPDKLYEIYVFFNLIKTLPENKNLKLLYSGNDYAVISSVGDVEITIYYQKTPQMLKEVSQYLEILDNYEINKSVKSPDVIIEFKKDEDVFYRLVEVKNSSETSYVRESLYKVMGYYKDFERSYKFTSKYPIVLVMWGGISLSEGYSPFNDKIIILNRLEFINNLEKMIKLIN